MFSDFDCDDDGGVVGDVLEFAVDVVVAVAVAAVGGDCSPI